MVLLTHIRQALCQHVPLSLACGIVFFNFAGSILIGTCLIQFVEVVSSLLMAHMLDFSVMHIVDDQNANCSLT